MGDETKPEVDLSSVSMQALTAELEKRFAETREAQTRLAVHLGQTDAAPVTPRPRTTKPHSEDLRKTQAKSPEWFQAQNSRWYHLFATKHDQKKMDEYLGKLKALGLPLLPKKKKKGSSGD